MSTQRLGEFLVSKGVMTRADLMDILRKQRGTRLRLGEYLVSEGFINDKELLLILGEFFDIKTSEISDIQVLPDLVAKISRSIGLRHKIVPVKVKGLSGAYLSSCELIPDSRIENLRRVFKIKIKPLLISKKDCQMLIERVYSGNMEDEDDYEDIVEEHNIIDAEEAIDIVDNMLLKAYSQKASDIHIEPSEDEVKIRFRIDGKLITVDRLSKELSESVISRIKVLSGMNIADRRNPQDGGFKFEKAGNRPISINLRAATLPCVQGEKMALRIMPTEDNILSFEELGMDSHTVEKFKEIIKFPHGLIFVTGPTGSGKSNTLYTTLMALRSDDVNITTVEDPVELQIKGINQTQTDNVNRFTFSKALRTILRQDPNIIMVGEVRDGETAALALESALTGHLVLSTLHTNDSTSSLARLIDMGCEPFLVTSSIRGVLAQRLVRVICPSCKESYKPEEEEFQSIGMEYSKETSFYRGKGCGICNGTGYRGRTGIFEFFTIDLETQKFIGNGMESNAVRRYAIENGMRTLRDDGVEKILNGITTVTEILKATME